MYQSYKRDPRDRSPLPLHEAQWEDTGYDLARGLLAECDHAGTLILDFKPPEPWEINIWVYKLLGLVYCHSSQMDKKWSSHSLHCENACSEIENLNMLTSQRVYIYTPWLYPSLLFLHFLIQIQKIKYLTSSLI